MRAYLLLIALTTALVVNVAAAGPPSSPAPPPIRQHNPVRWHIYQREHRTATTLGRKVRALRRRMRALQQQLEHARHTQAVTAHYQQWLCIHSYEGAWDANTGNGYYGGLQMDLTFQHTYGPELLDAKGTADHWTPLEQMQVAERAYQAGRGFDPWPNTARMCGLL